MRYCYDNLNLTELVALAKKHKSHTAHHGLPLDSLIKLIETEETMDHAPDPVDDDREAMLRTHETWEYAKMQLKCEEEHFACWDCPPARAVICAQEEWKGKNLLDAVKNRAK